MPNRALCAVETTAREEREEGRPQETDEGTKSVAEQRKMKKQRFMGIVWALCAISAGHAVYAQERTEPGAESGFYGGVSLRAGNAPSAGLNIGSAAASWGRLAAPPADDSSTR